jgi:hypothetical protein
VLSDDGEGRKDFDIVWTKERAKGREERRLDEEVRKIMGYTRV